MGSKIKLNPSIIIDDIQEDENEDYDNEMNQYDDEVHVEYDDEMYEFSPRKYKEDDSNSSQQDLSLTVMKQILSESILAMKNTLEKCKEGDFTMCETIENESIKNL